MRGCLGQDGMIPPLLLTESTAEGGKYRTKEALSFGYYNFEQQKNEVCLGRDTGTQEIITKGNTETKTTRSLFKQ